MGVGGKLGAKRRSEQRRTSEKWLKLKDDGMPFQRLQAEDGRIIYIPKRSDEIMRKGAVVELLDAAGDASGYVIEETERGQIVILPIEKLIFINGKSSPLHPATLVGIKHLLENGIKTEADVEKLVEAYNAAVIKAATHH